MELNVFMDIHKILNLSEEELKKIQCQPDSLFYNLNDIETFLDKTYSLIGSFCIVRKSDLFNKFKSLYEVMPSEIVENKDYLIRNKEDNIFVQLNKINYLIEHSKIFYGLIIINKNIIFNTLDKIYALAFEDIKFCREHKNPKA